MTIQDPRAENGANANDQSQPTKPPDDGGGVLRMEEGSPIIVGGGGSVNIHFLTGLRHYQPVVGSPGTFVKSNDEIDTVFLIDATGVLTNNLLSVVNGKNCQITIHTRIGNVNASDIVISSQPGALGSL